MYKRISEMASDSYRFPTVTHSVLSRCLDQTYHLLSDVALTGHLDTIEEIVLGENGIFVLESRDWAGRISCIGDSWVNNGTMMPSPSHYVKDAARMIRTMLIASGVLQYRNLWVDGVVVLLNENIDLRTNLAQVPILQLTEVCHYLTTTHTGFQFSQQELGDIRNILMNNRITPLAS
jgi:hypothetical protein